MSSKHYVDYSLSDTSFFSGAVDNYTVPIEIIQRLSKDLGFSYDLFLTLDRINKEASKSLISTAVTRSKRDKIVLLVDDESQEVLGYTADPERNPLTNEEFKKTAEKILSTSEELQICLDDSEDPASTLSTIIVKKKSPLIIEESFEGRESNFIPYEIGVVLFNNELENTTCRLVVYVDGQPAYLPASLYSSSTTRYKKSTPSSSEALEVLLLKIIDDLREDALLFKYQSLHYRYRHNKSIIATYEEYHTMLNSLRKMPTVIEDNSVLEPLTSLYEEFERKYNTLEDQKSSFLWRCTAIGEISIDALIHKVCEILNTLYAPVNEYMTIRDILGIYISTPRIVEDIAKNSSL